ncbi:DUF1192 domain-containing protein [Neoroseomonas oryzicola]|uniref:DUF1192 domain-containing protein n=1 Tax=Neoroseomonas oryzicola TaxID=535904 RepID=A0A9X9WK90_9PROT|nr:DUF1192 domain-containing protein [Neoroseomonas oryzicola]MBR0660750.1 DUF1192 domain-containing protein [Neoroseomonas oryzicola]NKE20260.1 DUF1192 domain-containing protein [Neoroseomonas oryzicola]
MAPIEEDNLPRKRQVLEKPRFDGWDVSQLQEYIVELKGEIARAEVAIGARNDHRSAAEAFFRKP